MAAVLFLHSGQMLKRKFNFFIRPVFVVLFLFLGIALKFTLGNFPTDYDGNFFGWQFTQMYFTTICISFGTILLISKFSEIVSLPFISTIGRSTLFIMGYNYMMNYVCYMLPGKNTLLHLLFVSCLATIGVYLINRYNSLKRLLV